MENGATVEDGHDGGDAWRRVETVRAMVDDRGLRCLCGSGTSGDDLCTSFVEL